MAQNIDVQEAAAHCTLLRADLLRMLNAAGSGHPGGSLSCLDILYVLYNHVMKQDPKNPKWDGRDRFVLSKGHVNPALYVVLADLGYFPKSELMTLRKFGSILQGHPYMHKTPGLDVSSGSPNRVYAMMGDGEQEEGEIWEAAMSAAHFKLDNLCGIVDHNHLQIDGNVEDVMNIEPIADKWRAFGWNVIGIDGHDYAQILDAFEKAQECKGKPTVIIAETVKGKGVSFMENQAGWHGAAPNDEQLKQALKELGQEG